jgi:uncharacterized membrane protein YcaP (DUF421 family)
VTTHSQRVEKILEGQEVLIGRDGRIFHDVMKKNRLAQSAIDYALRQADITVEEVDYAILEADGTISILKKKSKS